MTINELLNITGYIEVNGVPVEVTGHSRLFRISDAEPILRKGVRVKGLGWLQDKEGFGDLCAVDPNSHYVIHGTTANGALFAVPYRIVAETR